MSIGGSEPCAGLSVNATMLNPAAGSVTHEIGFSVAKPQGLGGFKLRLLHPVDSSAASESRRLIAFMVQALCNHLRTR
jgi:hypothetical protein